jgi:hypothetical protein
VFAIHWEQHHKRYLNNSESRHHIMVGYIEMYREERSLQATDLTIQYALSSDGAFKDRTSNRILCLKLYEIVCNTPQEKIFLEWAAA